MAELSDRMRALVQPRLAGIEPYDPSFTPCRINLSANENTYPLPASVRASVDAALAATPLNRYPDPLSGELRCEQRALVELEGPAVAAPHTNLAILTSPNNPTGNPVSASFVAQLCRACPGPVMVDEAYIEFADEGVSVERLLGSCPNLVILRTLSKAFGAAGIRCGYVLAAPDVIEVFAAIRQIYSVNVLTQAAALALVRARAERARLLAALEADERLEVWPSQGNFLLVRMDEASRIRERLRDERSILVRDFSYASGLEGCLRITVGTPEENDELLAALTALLDEEG